MVKIAIKNHLAKADSLIKEGKLEKAQEHIDSAKLLHKNFSLGFGQRTGSSVPSIKESHPQMSTQKPMVMTSQAPMRNTQPEVIGVNKIKPKGLATKLKNTLVSIKQGMGLGKARVDEGKSVSEKKDARRGRGNLPPVSGGYHPAGNYPAERGVADQEPGGRRGQSKIGTDIRIGLGGSGRNPAMESAKTNSKARRAELNRMPKPNLGKARIDEGKSVADKQYDRYKRGGDQTEGVHTAAFSTTPGLSNAGYALDIGDKGMARANHEMVRGQQKQMPKPTLKSDEIIDEEQLEKILPNQDYKVGDKIEHPKYGIGEVKHVAPHHVSVHFNNDAMAHLTSVFKPIPKKEVKKVAPMQKGDHTAGNPKIDVHYDGKYLHSTNWHKNLKSAHLAAVKAHPDKDPKKFKAHYDHEDNKRRGLKKASPQNMNSAQMQGLKVPQPKAPKAPSKQIGGPKVTAPSIKAPSIKMPKGVSNG